MLSLSLCRKILGSSDNELTDEALATLREELYCLASLALDLTEQTIGVRATIIEFEGNIRPDEAERRTIALAVENDHLN